MANKTSFEQYIKDTFFDERVVALWLGVPTVIVPVAFFLIKRLLKNKV